MIAAVENGRASGRDREEKSAGAVPLKKPIRSRPAIEKVLTVADQHREGPATGRRQGKLLGRWGAMVDPAVGDQYAVWPIVPQPRVKVVGGGQCPDAHHDAVAGIGRE